jgi:hypothetical protein
VIIPLIIKIAVVTLALTVAFVWVGRQADVAMGLRPLFTVLSALAASGLSVWLAYKMGQKAVTEAEAKFEAWKLREASTQDAKNQP